MDRDATPAYLRKPIVATRLRDAYPAVALPLLRFVVILRDPVHRLHAYWDTFVNGGAGVNDFSVWTQRTLEKVRLCQRSHGSELWPPPDTSKCDADTIEGVAAGLYSYQLQYWFKEFSPIRFLLTSLDAYERSAGSVLRDVSGFVGVHAPILGTPRAIGLTDTHAVKVMGGLPNGARSALSTFYKPHNAHLHKFLSSQSHAHYSPSLNELGIGSWT